MAATDTSSSTVISPPTSPTSPTPSLASPTGDPPEPEGKGKHLFKSNLQVLLKRQENELVKNFEYKKKLEEGEELEKDKDGIEGKRRKETDNRKRKDTSDKYEMDKAEGDDEVFEEPVESKAKTEGKEKTEGNVKKENLNQDKGKNNKELKGKDKGPKSPAAVKGGKGKEKPPEMKRGKESESKGERIQEKSTPEKGRDQEAASPTLSRKEEEGDGKGKKKPAGETETKEKINKEDSLKEKKEDTHDEKKNGMSSENTKTGKPKDDARRENDTKSASQPETSPKSPNFGTPSSSSSPASHDPREEKSKECPSVKQTKRQKHQGTLMKKGSSPFSLWKKYYFVLDGKRLMYYRSDNDYKNLAGAKGCLDLATLEDVKIKKPGRMKSPFPFGLYRKNQRTIHLGTDTNEEREKWMAILLGTKRHDTRLSGSDSVLSTSDSPVEEAKNKKYATMPVGNVPPKAEVSSSDSEPEDKKDEEEKLEDKKDKEEKLELIQPKKIGRVGIGLPVDLGAVKLKKVSEKPNTAEKPTESEKAAADNELFGVKLKKLAAEGTVPSDSDKEEKEPGTEKPLLKKRPNKQAIIPLNKSPRLIHTDVETDRKSLSSKTTTTTERKRSPSPCIPLSKGVHAVLSKSNEETETESSNDLTVRTAVCREIRYSEAALSLEDEVSVEYLQADDKPRESSENLEVPERGSKELPGNGEDKEFGEIPQVSVTVKENPEEAEYEEFDEEFLRTMEENKTAELSQRLSDRFNDENLPGTENSNANAGNDISESSEEEQGTVGNSKPIRSSCLTNDNQETNKEEVDEEFSRKVSFAHIPSEKGGKQSPSEVLSSSPGRATPQSPFRRRTGTNESSNSSCKSDSENSDKKIGRFKLFQIKQSCSSDDEKEKDEKKDSKRRKKSSFSKFLPGIKNKVRKAKDGDESLENPPVVSNSSEKGSVESDKEPQPMPNDNVSSEKAQNLVDYKVQGVPELNIPQISLHLEDSGTERANKVELRPRQHSVKDEARSSTYSRSSITSPELDPPPLVPEKKGMRATSPGHDVPQNNRPVTVQGYEETEMAERKDETKVDGVISVDQIDAILSAKDKEKKRKSGCFDSGGFSGPVERSQNLNEKAEGSYDRMASVVSITSTESDEPLPKFNFLSCTSNRSSSESSKNRDKNYDSDVSSDAQTDTSRTNQDSVDQDISATLSYLSRLTESMHSGTRGSLNIPQFTVEEEEGTGTSDQVSAGDSSEETPVKEEDEQNDYFPVIGGGVNLRHPSSSSRGSQFSDAGLRTSGINGLKAFLEENQPEDSSSRSGISRLGHSAAVEKLRRVSSEDTDNQD
ncbi:muscle M-line assembly protein unc-89-like [Macrobrachium nipponense]|uniref:muscle M-line assembly protein unc-89-like n=1 Tax=Macrobrachium nipponense TaxID=159736 RepID=UPI0030C85054